MVVKPRTSLNRIVMLAFFAAEHELLRRTRELLDQGRRKVQAEGGANLVPILLFAEIIYEQ